MRKKYDLRMDLSVVGDNITMVEVIVVGFAGIGGIIGGVMGLR